MTLTTTASQMDGNVWVELEHSCACGVARHVIGEGVSERLDIIQAQFRMIVTRRPKYACRSCEGGTIQAPALGHLFGGPRQRSPSKSRSLSHSLTAVRGTGNRIRADLRKFRRQGRDGQLSLAPCFALGMRKFASVPRNGQNSLPMSTFRARS